MSKPESFVPRKALRPRRLARLGLQSAMYWTGFGYTCSKLSSSGALILMYHSIAGEEAAGYIDPRNRISPTEFEEHMSYLARHRQVISIDALSKAIVQKDDLPPGTVVITFDDGYRDNLEVAAPILARHGLPAILYLPTELISAGENPWVDELYSAFRFRREDRLEVSQQEELRRFDLGSSPDDRLAYQYVAGLLMLADREQRLELLAQVKEQLAPRADCELRPLSWDELRGMRETYPDFALGLHSDTHIDLTAHGLDRARLEIQRCQATFTKELGRSTAHFAYPYNRNNRELWDLLRGEGFKTAVSDGISCSIDRSTNLLSLPRVASPRSRTLFKLWTQGSSLPLRFAGSS